MTDLLNYWRKKVKQSKFSIFKMIISKTPFRISFVGGGTDIPSYFKKNGGHISDNH